MYVPEFYCNEKECTKEKEWWWQSRLKGNLAKYAKCKVKNTAVNESWRRKAANVKVKELEISNVCTLKLDENIKCSFQSLPVPVTEVIRNKGHNPKYKLASKQGFIKRTFLAKHLSYHEGYTSEIIQIFPAQLDKKKPVSIHHACTAFRGQTSCACKGDCSKISRCLCKAALSQRKRCKQTMHIS